MKKEDELLIQKKIDGILTAEEEERFIELIENSVQAHELYRKLLELHHSIVSDAESVPVIDFSKEIMQKLNDHKVRNRFSRFSTFRTNVLAYAAILFVGLFIGSIATYLGTSTNQTIDESQLLGTIADDPEQNFDFNGDGIEIKVREFKTSKVDLTTISINTIDTIQCRIQANNKEFTSRNIKLQFSEGQFQLKDTMNNELQYSCCGSLVFQINRINGTKNLDSLLIRFVRDGLIINQLDLK